MRRPRDDRNGTPAIRRPGVWARLVAAVPLLFVTACLVGCPGNNRRPEEGDVLKGDFKFLKEGEPKATTQAKSPVPVTGVPPIPEYTHTMSTAAMAAALPLNGPRPLSIPDESAAQGKFAKPGEPVPVGNGWSAPPGGAGGTAKPGGTTIQLGPVQPITPVAKKEGGPVGAGAVPGPTSVTYEQLQQELKKRGVLWQRQPELTPTGVKFTCAVPHPQQPQAEWVVEAEAPDLLTAMQKALAALDGR